ncbi:MULTISPECIES: hypothetical protein [Commensalibacter]|uniref:Lipoprotein n=2 Tax=Commensalibacter TaxID=1079922 RepID=W7E1E6_9PROT|nr:MULTISPECIES: hypothetical protein [Commensalibacter]EUK18894.1 hypothetical protein COMX_04070 [Commensalibacter papalotli (ex Servin-Garciduenas et al. 2014)]CAI3925878.1 unnamed protein product [Commensalibacter papalotli (ex Botero et al. 2024)]CAI3926178.1 unnamed protein product [Commensalibacter papalotli (ex Botero et al. 2024)]
MNKSNLWGGFLVLLMLAGCSGSDAPTDLQLTKTLPSQLRNMQSKQFNQSNQKIVLQSIIKTLASLDFQIVRVDVQLGIIEAMQLDHDHIMQVNVVIQPASGRGSLVRINARYNQYPVEETQFYQRFFDTLSRNLY